MHIRSAIFSGIVACLLPAAIAVAGVGPEGVSGGDRAQAQRQEGTDDSQNATAQPAATAGTVEAAEEKPICKPVKQMGSNRTTRLCKTRAQLRAEQGHADDVISEPDTP